MAVISLSSLQREKYLWQRGDCFELIKDIPSESVQLILTSPPYNIGKEYEAKIDLARYLVDHEKLLSECQRILKPTGSICWQVGNYVEGSGEIIPLDIMLYRIFKKFDFKLRNRIVWTYGHGMHARHRFSGRYENVMWFTLEDDYVFNLDDVRVPQKQPTKRFYKGPRKGEISSNPLGKNPGDVWEITNIKNGHPEKISGGHPCQFPVKLAERMILALSDPRDVIFDPFGGVASTLIAALKNDRRVISCEIEAKYHKVGSERIRSFLKENGSRRNARRSDRSQREL